MFDFWVIIIIVLLIIGIFFSGLVIGRDRESRKQTLALTTDPMIELYITKENHELNFTMSLTAGSIDKMDNLVDRGETQLLPIYVHFIKPQK